MGVLKYFSDNYSDIKEHIVPFVLVTWGQEISSELFAVLQEVIPYNTIYREKKMIARPSLPADWDGLVDYLPTPQMPLERYMHNKNLFYAELYEGMRNTLWREKISDITIWISPYINHDLFTVTENPNEYDRFYIDRWKQWANEITETFELRNDELVNQRSRRSSVDEWDKYTVESVIELIQRIRDKNVFDKNERLQYEIGIQWDKVLLFQIRKFCDKFPTYTPYIRDLLLDNKQYRCMWNMDIINTSMKHRQIEGRLDQLPSIYQEMQENFVLIFSDFWWKENIDHKTPFLKWFVSNVQKALFHSLTGPAQLALKNWWFAAFPAKYDEKHGLFFSYAEIGDKI